MFCRMLGAIGLICAAAIAVAGPQYYSTRSQTIRAGVVILPTAKASLAAQPQSAGPYALYNLDSSTQIKPAGWNFVNPMAPGRVTPTIYNRWSLIDATTPAVGTAISKRNAAYWEVNLDNLTDAQVGNYDFLIVNPTTYASLNPLEQERLRRFVDQGGLLWIDPANLNGGLSGLDIFNNFPIPFWLGSPSGLVEQSDFNSSLLTSINPITPGDIAILDGGVGSSYVLTTPPSAFFSGMQSLAGGNLSDFYLYQAVSALSGSATISVGRIGDGIVVVTSLGASIMLNRTHGATYAQNRFFTGFTPTLDADGQSAAKLAINMVGMLDEYRQENSGSRKTGSIAIDANPPLIQTSNVADFGFTQTQGASSPALYKGYLVTTSDGVLKVYNAHPGADLNGNGFPDAGLPDYSGGTSYDEIWQVALTGPLSSPVCTDIPGGGPNGATDEVLVVDGAGNLDAFNLEPRDPITGYLSPIAQPLFSRPPPNSSMAMLDTSVSPAPFAPAVDEGIAYVTENYTGGPGNLSGFIWQVDLSTGNYVTSTQPFAAGGQGSPVNLPEFSYGSTVGYIPILDNSGGVDKVIYTPFQANPTAGVSAGGFLSLWIGSKGERPISFDPPVGQTSTTGLQVTTRASQQGGLPIYTNGGPLGVKLTLLDANGNALTAAQMATIFQGSVEDMGNGILNFPWAGATNSLPAGITGVRLDYTIDWGLPPPQNAALASLERGRIMMPDQAGTSPIRSIIGGVALSPQGTAYVVSAPRYSATGPFGGALYGFREQGRGQFTCVSRFELYNGYQITLNQSAPVNAAPVFYDNDDLTRAFPPGNFINTLLSAPMTNFTFVGGATIRNGQVVAMASAQKPTNPLNPLSIKVPVTVLMAFNAEPPTPQFVIGNLPPGAEILQPDLARSTDTQIPEVQSVMVTGNYQYDTDTDIISFPSLSSTNRGQIQNCLNTSQPIIVRIPGQSDMIVQPETVSGGVWNPLQWFYVVDGMTPIGATALPGGSSSPLITGNSVFFGGSSVLPNILLTGSAVNPSGVLYAVNSLIPATQLHPLPNKPWFNQLWSIELAGSNPSNPGVIGDPNILWPQLSTTKSVSDFALKLNQTTLGGATGPDRSTTTYGVVGGDGIVASWGDGGLYTFTRGDVLLCDQGRVIDMDAGGNPIWSTDSTISPGKTDVTSAGTTNPLVSPARAYKLSNNNYMVVDAGSNRVATINSAGIESRSISSFMLDPRPVIPSVPQAVIPSGYVAGEPLTLSAPRDALYYTTVVNMTGAVNAQLVSLGDGETLSVGNPNYELWKHYLIADTGNKRLVEIIDRYYYQPLTQQIAGAVTVGGTPQVGVLLWHSPAAVSGKNYAYSSLNRVEVPDANGGHFVYVTGIGGSLPTPIGNSLDPGVQPTSPAEATDGSGGIVVFDPTIPNGALTINTMSMPNLLNTAFWDPATGTFDNVINQSTQAGLTAYARRSGGTVRFKGLNSVTAKVISVGENPEIAIMVADSTGVYEGLYVPGTTSSTLGLDWIMPNEVYTAIKQTAVGNNVVPSGSNALGLRAMYARRLDSGDIMIVNGYNGYTINGGSFAGEIMQIGVTVNTDWTAPNLGFGNASITLDLSGQVPGIGTRGILLPVYANRQ